MERSRAVGWGGKQEVFFIVCTIILVFFRNRKILMSLVLHPRHQVVVIPRENRAQESVGPKGPKSEQKVRPKARAVQIKRKAGFY